MSKKGLAYHQDVPDPVGIPSEPMAPGLAIPLAALGSKPFSQMKPIHKFVGYRSEGRIGNSVTGSYVGPDSYHPSVHRWNKAIAIEQHFTVRRLSF